MPKKRSSLVRDVRKALETIAEPDTAEGMRAYMKSEMPCLGVKTKPREQALKQVFAKHTFDDPKEWKAAVLDLWRSAEFREERYAAIDLSGKYKAFITFDAIDMFEEIIVTGAWWDLVDPIATQRFARIFERSAKKMTALMRKWAKSEDLWKRRSAIICQIKRRSETDLELLSFAIDHNIKDTDFFIRKAIGWALRSHAHTDPDWVRAFVKAREDQLSGLSRREAMKHL